MPRSSPQDHMNDSIDSIPDSKPIGTFGSPGTKIYRDQDYRLDMEGYTTEKDGKGIKFNPQVQVDKGCTKKSVARIALVA